MGHLIGRFSLEKRMKILLILALVIGGGSAHFSRFFPYWVEKELNLPVDETQESDELAERQIMKHSKTLRQRQSIMEENTDALYSLLNRQPEPRHSMMLRNKKLKSIQKLRRLRLLRSRKRSGAVTEKSKEQEEEMDGEKSNRYLTYRLALRS